MKRTFLILLLLSGICYARFDSNLVAWWKLNDNAATTVVVDSIGSNTGTASANTDTKSVVGKVNRALIFDALDDEVNCGSDSSIDNIFDGGGTISIWLLSSGRGENSQGHALGKTTWLLQMILNTTTMRFQQDFTATPGQWHFNITAGIWQHVVIVYDSDLAVNNPTVYLNGVSVLVDEQSTPGSDNRVTDGDDTFIIGDNKDSARSWDGKIDNVMLFTRELNKAEAKYLYNGGRGLEVVGQRILRGRNSGNRRIRQNIH